MALTICLEPGCGRDAVRRSRCPEHARAYQLQQGRPSDRNGWAWMRERERVLAEHPTCQRCHMRPSEVVHHVLAVRHGGHDDRPNLLAVCGPCHRELEGWSQGVA